MDAVKHYEQALALDPKFGNAAAALAWMYREAQWTEARSKELGLTMKKLATRQMPISQRPQEPFSGVSEFLTAKLNMQQRSDEAIAAAERAIALDASDPDNYEWLSDAMT